MAKKKILLIEDNQDHALIAKRVLRDYEVDLINEPKGGLQKLNEVAYDLILCDYRLPGLSALEVLKDMKRNNKDSPLIVITSAGSEKIAVDVMKEGAYDYIVKDSTFEDVLPMVIKKALERYGHKKDKEIAEQKLKEAYVELKKTQMQLVQAEKMEGIGRMASGVAHEVRNPLGIVLQGIGYLERTLPKDKKDDIEILQLMKKNIERADRIISALVDFSKATSMNMVPMDINSVLESSLILTEHAIKLKNVKVIREMKEGLSKVMVDAQRLEQVFVNILHNAAYAMKAGDRLFIRSYESEFDASKEVVSPKEKTYFRTGEKVVVSEIEDTGAGIPDEDKDKIFEAFYTTKGPKGGVGLGLSVAKNIIDMHRGLIKIESDAGKGTKVTVILKLAEE